MPGLLSLPLKLTPQVRLQALCDLMTALLKGFDGVEFEEVLENGVEKQQLLKTVYVVYLNADDHVVGYFALTIDWDKFRINASSDENDFDFDASLTVEEQITEVHRLMMARLQTLKQRYGVVTQEMQYAYIKEVEEDPERLQQVRAQLGLAPVKEREGNHLLEAAQKGDEYTSKRSTSLTARLVFETRAVTWRDRLQRWMRRRLSRRTRGKDANSKPD